MLRRGLRKADLLQEKATVQLYLIAYASREKELVSIGKQSYRNFFLMASNKIFCSFVAIFSPGSKLAPFSSNNLTIFL